MKMENGDGVEFSTYGRNLKHNQDSYNVEWSGTAIQVHIAAVRVEWARPGRKPFIMWHNRREIRLRGQR